MPHPIWNIYRQTSLAGWSAIPEGLRDLIGPDDDRDEIANSLLRLRAAGLDVTDPDIFALAVEGARNNAAQPDTWRAPLRTEDGIVRPMRPPGEVDSRSVVYYARIGNRVKIGYSLSLAKRMSAINPEELMATEPGGPKLEAERHRRFRELRTHGEWFRLEEPLVSHIASLRGKAA